VTWRTAFGHTQQLPSPNQTESVMMARASRMSARVRPQTAVIDTAHYSLLRTIEDLPG